MLNFTTIQNGVRRLLVPHDTRKNLRQLAIDNNTEKRTFYFYFTWRENRRYVGVLKIGQTRNIKKRMQDLRVLEKDLRAVCYAEVNDILQSQADVLESVLRSAMQEQTGCQLFGNDHFAYKLNNDRKAGQIERLATHGMTALLEYCQFKGWNITIHNNTASINPQ